MEIKETKPQIFVLCGKARHGKDTAASMIGEMTTSLGKKVINLQFSTYLKNYAAHITGWDGSDETKPRELLQQLGTSIIREKIDPLFFVKKMVEDIKVYAYFFDVITISDARTKVEVDTIRNTFPHVTIVQVIRPNFENGLTEEQKKHFTEVDLDDYHAYDEQVVNDGTLLDLEEKIKKIVEKEVEGI